MTRFKLRSVQRGYDWSEVITAYMGTNSIKPLDEVVLLDTKTEIQAEALYSQLLAMDMEIA